MPAVYARPNREDIVTSQQQRFISLHERYATVEWRELFSGAQIRASTDQGITATLSRGELDELIAMGVMHRGPGLSLRASACGCVSKALAS